MAAATYLYSIKYNIVYIQIKVQISNKFIYTCTYGKLQKHGTVVPAI